MTPPDSARPAGDDYELTNIEQWAKSPADEAKSKSEYWRGLYQLATDETLKACAIARRFEAEAKGHARRAQVNYEVANERLERAERAEAAESQLREHMAVVVKERDAARTHAAGMENRAEAFRLQKRKAESDLARLREACRDVLIGCDSPGLCEFHREFLEKRLAGAVSGISGADGRQPEVVAVRAAQESPPAKPASGADDRCGLGCTTGNSAALTPPEIWCYSHNRVFGSTGFKPPAPSPEPCRVTWCNDGSALCETHLRAIVVEAHIGKPLRIACPSRKPEA